MKIYADTSVFGGVFDNVRDFYHAKIGAVEISDFLPEAQDLHEAYLAAGVVAAKSATDAGHVAMATVLNCRAIVSWNFKHIVHSDKIRRYNAVNESSGYGRIDIFSPLEVIYYGDA